MKSLLLAVTAVCLFTGSFAQIKKRHLSKKATPVSAYNLVTNLDSVSYAYGVGLIKDLKNREIKTLNYAALNKAITDGLGDKTLLLTPEQSKAVIAKHYVIKYIANVAPNNRFIADNKNKPGVVTTKSGLQYMVLQKGTGAIPGPKDTVRALYRGTVISGKEFDSSLDAGKPFVTAVDKVIPGWTEGLQLMNAGSKYRFFIPFNLAYNDRGFDDVLVPYSTLIFDVELLKVIKANP